MSEKKSKPQPEMPLPEETPLEYAFSFLIDLYVALRRQWLAFSVLFFGTSALLIAAITAQTPMYRSTAFLLVKFGREHVYQASAGRSFAPRTKETIVNSELVIIRSQSVLEAVVKEYGVAKLFPAMLDEMMLEDPGVADKVIAGHAVNRLRDALDVQAMADADVIRIGFSHPDPQIAADIVNLAVEKLTEKHIEVFGEDESAAFFEARVAESRSALERAEEKLRVFQTDNQSFAGESADAELSQRRLELQTALRQTEEKIAAVRLRDLQKDSATTQAELELLGLENDEKRYTGELKRKVQERIQVLTSFLADRRGETQLQVRRHQAERRSLQAELAEVQAQFATLPGLSSEHRQLLRDRDAIEEQYNTYVQRLHEARISSEMDREKLASIRLIQKAVPALNPSTPWNLKLQAGIAVVFSLGMALLVAIFLDAMMRALKRRAMQPEGA